MHWAGLFSWAIGLIALFIMIWSLRVAPHPAQTLTPPKVSRSLKPRSPDDCPLCQRPHPTSRWRHARKPGVKPWPECKNPRGRPKTICTAGRACPRPECDYYGNPDPTFHALVGHGVRGGIQQFQCQACGRQLSSRLGTALYRLRTPACNVAPILTAFKLGLSAAEVQVLFGHSDATLRTWLTRAGRHAGKVHQPFFRHLSLGHLQFDELYTTLRDKAHALWVWVAFDPKTKLIPALCLGPRTQDMAHALRHTVVTTLAPGCVPVCTSDGLNLYFYALTAHFGAWWTDPATGKPKWRAGAPGPNGVALELLYGQVKKSYRRRKLAQVERRMQLGQREDLQAALQRLGFTGSINTAFVERLNLQPISEWWRAYYHLCRPHQSQRLKLPTPQARRGRQTPRGYPLRGARRPWRRG